MGTCLSGTVPRASGPKFGSFRAKQHLPCQDSMVSLSESTFANENKRGLDTRAYDNFYVCNLRFNRVSLISHFTPFFPTLQRVRRSGADLWVPRRFVVDVSMPPTFPYHYLGSMVGESLRQLVKFLFIVLLSKPTVVKATTYNRAITLHPCSPSETLNLHSRVKGYIPVCPY